VIRPDPARGVFETVRVEGGRAHHLDDHLARLSASVRALYGVPLQPPALPRMPIEPQRLRILARPDGTTEASFAPLGEPNLLLAPWTVPGGLGEHKWADRRAIDEATERFGATPLILDEDGSVLEASWANVWIREGDRLITPPADGRLLPGVTRARVFRIAPDLGLVAREEALTLERLHGADVIVLTSSLRLAVSAREDEAVAALANALR
jgi:branched-subunit amino acid aminotransferase/4-amino-4-deoxychorismate lyase